MKNIIFADGIVGVKICKWLLTYHQKDVDLIVTVNSNNITDLARSAGVSSILFESEDQILKYIKKSKHVYDWGFLIWWPKIISQELLRIPDKFFINTHPSFLPYNRGKHPNFWSLVNQNPFGVTLHLVENGIDSGDIISQEIIDYDWEDTAATLYNKSLNRMVSLFEKTYPLIRNNQFKRMPQHPNKGDFHLAKEIDPSSIIDLNKKYYAHDLLNLIRARSFAGHPSCSFKDENNEKFDVNITIKRSEK